MLPKFNVILNFLNSQYYSDNIFSIKKIVLYEKNKKSIVSLTTTRNNTVFTIIDYGF